MYQLLYVSAARPRLPRAEIAAILEASRRNNPKIGVTGLLLNLDGGFLQILEGPQDAVETLFATIAQDPRHTQCTVMLRRPVAAHSFSDWSMGYDEPDETVHDGDLFRLTREAVANRLPRDGGIELVVMLDAFYRINRGRHAA